MISTNLTRDQKIIKLQLLEEKKRRQSRRKINTYYPEIGELRRELYARHMEFFRLGKDHSTRCFMAANRVGKTEGGGGYEVTLHLTGLYPEWWEGRRFDHPTDCWAAGDTNETVRDIIQLKMIGAKGNEGTGLIPGDLIDEIKYRQSSNGSADYVTVKHASGGVSRLGFKSYEQGRVSFQGTEKNVVWLDEESNEGIRTECIMRLMTTEGLLIETFTPLKGLTKIVLGYIGDEGVGTEKTRINGDKAFIMAGWDDVPHLSQSVKDRMLSECEPHLRDARSRGIPSLGAGAIYPVSEESIMVDDFDIPKHWPRGYALDVGWNRTAVVWGAKNLETGEWFLYSEYYVGQAEPVIHAAGIRSRGEWVPGSIDPAARGRGQKDGEQLLQNYVDLGLHLQFANNGVESGIYSVWERLSTGKLKVFKSLRNWFSEYRVYRRDERGHVVKSNDHLMDATRYLMATGDEYIIVKPAGNLAPIKYKNTRRT
jgi:phage terminase large subunit-like protein